MRSNSNAGVFSLCLKESTARAPISKCQSAFSTILSHLIDFLYPFPNVFVTHRSPLVWAEVRINNALCKPETKLINATMQEGA